MFHVFSPSLHTTQNSEFPNTSQPPWWRNIRENGHSGKRPLHSSLQTPLISYRGILPSSLTWNSLVTWKLKKITKDAVEGIWKLKVGVSKEAWSIWTYCGDGVSAVSSTYFLMDHTVNIDLNIIDGSQMFHDGNFLANIKRRKGNASQMMYRDIKRWRKKEFPRIGLVSIGRGQLGAWRGGGNWARCGLDARGN